MPKTQNGSVPSGSPEHSHSAPAPQTSLSAAAAPTQSLFQKLFGGIAAPAGEPETTASSSHEAQQPNVLKQAFGNVANSWRAVLSGAMGADASTSGGDSTPWTRAGSPFLRIALCGESQSGRSTLARHAEGRLRKMSQRAAPFIEKRVASTQRAGGTSYTYEVNLRAPHQRTYSTLVTLSDTGPSPIGTAGTSLRELQQSDAIVLVFPLTGVKQRQRAPQTRGKVSAGVSPETVLLSPQSEALLVRLLSAVTASRYDASVRVYIVATFMDCLSDASIPATRSVLVRLRSRAQELFPNVVLTHLFAVSFPSQACVSETSLTKPDELLEVADMWTAMFRTLCGTALHSETPSAAVDAPAEGVSMASSPLLVWRPVPYSVVLKRLQDEWCSVDSSASLMAEPAPLTYMRDLEANMNVPSQRGLLFIEQSQARQDVVFLSVGSLWKRLFALGVTSHDQFTHLLHYLEGRGQILVFVRRTLRRGQLPPQRTAWAPKRSTTRTRSAPGGSRALSDCICMHPRLLRQAEAALFWYHRLVTTGEKRLESVLYGVNTEACRRADTENEAARGYFCPALLQHLAEHLTLPEHFTVSPTQRLQIFVSLLCFADVGCVLRERTSPTSAMGQSSVSPARLPVDGSLMETSAGDATSQSTLANVFFSADARGPHLVEIENVMGGRASPRSHVPTTATATARAGQLDVSPFARVQSDALPGVASAASFVPSEDGTLHSTDPLGHSAMHDLDLMSSARNRGDAKHRWRLCVPSLLVTAPCPSHLLQTAAACVGGPGRDGTAGLAGSRLVYALSPCPPPSLFAVLAARFASWHVPPLFSDALWLWPTSMSLCNMSRPKDARLMPPVRLLIALVPARATDSSCGGANANTVAEAHLELYCFADTAARLSLSLIQQEAVVEIESLLHQNFSELGVRREEQSWIETTDRASEEASRCTSTSDLDVLFSCSE